MNSKQRASKIIAEFFSNSEDSIRYRYNYHSVWLSDLCSAITAEIDDALAEECSNNNKCCFCEKKVPGGVLREPFEKGEDELPKVYGVICAKCANKCKKGIITESEFRKAVGHE